MIRLISISIITLLIFTFFAGCSDPPTEELDAAEKALLDARGSSDCAQEQYAAALKMLEEAKQLAADEEYDAAKLKAEAARNLAEKAKQDGLADWDECQRRKAQANMIKNPPKEETKTTPKITKEDDYELQTVYFQFNSTELAEDSKTALGDNSSWIKRNSGLLVVVEGHCDERGSTEFNLALGERRAVSVKKYMVRMGVDPNKLAVVSFGEEKPLSYGRGETDYRKNRRVEFSVRK